MSSSPSRRCGNLQSRSRAHVKSVQHVEPRIAGQLFRGMNRRQLIYLGLSSLRPSSARVHTSQALTPTDANSDEAGLPGTRLPLAVRSWHAHHAPRHPARPAVSRQRPQYVRHRDRPPQRTPHCAVCDRGRARLSRHRPTRCAAHADPRPPDCGSRRRHARREPRHSFPLCHDRCHGSGPRHRTTGLAHAGPAPDARAYRTRHRDLQ
jgi:hypothetical protein